MSTASEKMAAIFCENCSFLHLQHGRIFFVSEANGALVLIMLGKVLLNLYVLRVRKQTLRESFMSCFCISLAFFDLVLLVTMAFISYFQNFMLLGIHVTEYHICLLAQITALTYGILHYPVCFLAGLDYYITITQTSEYPNRCWRLLYAIVLLFIWILALCYVLNFPGSFVGLDANNYISVYQCPFYISSQSYWLSLGMLFIICLVLVLRWSDIVDMVQSIKLTYFERETVLFFPYVLECSPKDHAKHLLTRLLICFMGTWAPFFFLQTLVVLLGAQIPAYIEMNVPWLYFVNSFLIAITCWVRRQHIELKEEPWDVDPFVSWKFCFVPFSCQDVNEAQKPVTEIVVY
ncbi:probable G-protein coupled receptor 160 [Sceloporus undulatus]|uniref:probable G-protein coupled receptor 160 n=1 Tax=Sceloporus undulatus TaxID=8520 RepID=UPI001C4BFD4C|nr:probable G-protein coupled receptor 160 [Sceloporus undulatus]